MSTTPNIPGPNNEIIPEAAPDTSSRFPISASYAITASYALNGGSGGGGSGSAVSASYAAFAALAGTASFVNLARSASYVASAQTASYVANAQSASYVGLAQTASYVANAQSASYSDFARTASYVSVAQPTASHVIYVRKGGNDTTGNGTIENPYLTVTKALSTITTPVSTFRWIIDVGAGNFTETSPLNIKAYTYIVGNGIGASGPTRLVASQFGVDSTVLGGTARFGYKNVYLNGSINIDLTTASAASRVFECVEMGVTDNFTFKSQNSGDFVDLSGGRIFGNSEFYGCSLQILGMYLIGTTLATSNANSFNGAIQNCAFGGTLTANQSGGAGSVTLQLIGCNGNALVASGSGVTVYADAISLPDSTTITGANLIRTTSAPAINYVPADNSKWAGNPSTIAQAIDRIAAVVGVTPIP